MSSTLAGWLQALALVGALALCYRPLGDYIAKLLTTAKHLRVERGLYKVIGVDGDAVRQAQLASDQLGLAFLKSGGCGSGRS